MRAGDFSMMDNLPGFAYVQAEDYSIHYANRFFRERFGGHENVRCYEIHFNAKEPCKNCLTSTAIRTFIPQKREWVSPDGNTYLICYSPFRETDGTPMVLKTGIDITEQKRREDELVRIRNLESLNILARGIAHDFNNLLTSILGNISLGKMSSNQEDKIYGILMDAEKACFRTRDLINQLLIFAKCDTPVRKKTMITRLLNESAGAVLKNSNIKCILSFQDDLWAAEADERQMMLVFNNIFANARHAFPEGGTVNVRVENITISPAYVLPINEGKYIRISLTDNGPGIPADFIPKIFDPYMTTKEMGKEKGVGLGLAICYSIVKKHGGYITVNPASEAGTVFTIYLPVSREDHTENERTGEGQGERYFAERRNLPVY